jgi:hypothetical protein
MTAPHPPAQAADQPSGGKQRFGHMTGRQPSAGRPGKPAGTYLVRDEETGITYAFTDADIVTEGLRTLRTGERVRFLIDPDHRHARYVIRLDLPDIREYY